MNKKFSHFKRSGIIISIMRQRTKDILQRSCSIRPKIRIYPPSIRDDDVMVIWIFSLIQKIWFEVHGYYKTHVSKGIHINISIKNTKHYVI